MAKTTTVYPSTADGLQDILGAAIDDEPTPTPAAAQLVEEAIYAGPVLPDASTLPTLTGTGGGPGELLGAVPPPPSPRESAENLIQLAFALVPAGDWQPDSDQEREELVAALQRVFEVRGWSVNLPPEAILIAVMGKYGRKRFKRPAVQAKLGPWLSRLPLIGKLVGAQAHEPDPEPRQPVGWPAGSLPAMTPAVE